MRALIFNSASRGDLLEIWEYIAAANVEAADGLIARIEADIQRLAEMPGIGHQRADVRDEHLRFWAVRPYVIVYRYTRRTVYVMRIVHGARNFRKLFRKR